MRRAINPAMIRRVNPARLKYPVPRVYKFLRPTRMLPALGSPPMRVPAYMKLPFRSFSQLFEPDPSSNGIIDGNYLVRMVETTGDVSVIEHILDSGVDPNFRADHNETALMIAAENDGLDIMSLLLARGANPNLQDDLGETALIKASREGHKDAVQMLLHHGAQADILNYEQMTARETAMNVEVDELLNEHGVHIHGRPEERQARTHEKIFINFEKKTAGATG